ncbi:MAG: hypothetical protein M3406_03820, partial [Chloroflexota bacterium]|nr:hypothetical protein [Chloroflexota bacterium]
MRSVGTANDTTAGIASLLAGEVPPRVIGATLEATAAGNAGDWGKAAAADGEAREVRIGCDRFGEFHATSLRPAAGERRRRGPAGFVAPWLRFDRRLAVARYRFPSRIRPSAVLERRSIGEQVHQERLLDIEAVLGLVEH